MLEGTLLPRGGGEKRDYSQRPLQWVVTRFPGLPDFYFNIQRHVGYHAALWASPCFLFWPWILRRQAAKRELGLAYGLEDDQAKFSQAEVNAKIRER